MLGGCIVGCTFAISHFFFMFYTTFHVFLNSGSISNYDQLCYYVLGALTFGHISFSKQKPQRCSNYIENAHIISKVLKLVLSYHKLHGAKTDDCVFAPHPQPCPWPQKHKATEELRVFGKTNQELTNRWVTHSVLINTRPNTQEVQPQNTQPLPRHMGLWGI